MSQDSLMACDPATGDPRPYPSHAAQWRKFHGTAAWLYNPWLGTRRNAWDIGSDPFGLAIVPPGEELKPALKVTLDPNMFKDALRASAERIRSNLKLPPTSFGERQIRTTPKPTRKKK